MYKRQVINPGDKLIVLGGPAMLIGLGGGAASSMASGSGPVSYTHLTLPTIYPV